MSRAVRVLQDVDPRCIKFMKIAHLCRFAVFDLDGKMHVDIVTCVPYHSKGCGDVGWENAKTLILVLLDVK